MPAIIQRRVVASLTIPKCMDFCIFEEGTNLPRYHKAGVDVDAGLGVEPRAIVTAAVFELAHPVAAVGFIRGIE